MFENCIKIRKTIENIISSDLAVTDEPKEGLSDNMIVNNEFNCDPHIAEHTDDSNGNRNDGSNENINLSNCFKPIIIDEIFEFKVTTNTSANNVNLDSKINDVNNSVFQLKDHIDQARKLLHDFWNTEKVALNTEPTGYNLDVENHLETQDNSQNHSQKKRSKPSYWGFNSVRSQRVRNIKRRNYKNPNISLCSHWGYKVLYNTAFEKKS